MQLGELCNCCRVLGRSGCPRDKYWQREALSVSRANVVVREVWWSVVGLGTSVASPRVPAGGGGSCQELRL